MTFPSWIFSCPYLKNHILGSTRIEHIHSNPTPNNKIQNKLLVGENVTPEELEILNDYYSSEQFRNSYKKLKEAAQEGLATIKRLQTAYSKLNDIGQEKVAEHAEMIAKIPEYQKDPDEPQED